MELEHKKNVCKIIYKERFLIGVNQSNTIRFFRQLLSDDVNLMRTEFLKLND